MEKQNQNTSKLAILVPVFVAVIAGTCTLLAAVIGLATPIADRLAARLVQPTAVVQSGQALNEPQTNVQPAGKTGGSEPTRDLLETYRPELITAITNALNTEAVAFQSLDARPLYTVYSGEALKAELASMQGYMNNRVFAVIQTPDLNFGEMKILDSGARAEVKVDGTTHFMFVSVDTRQCVSYFPNTTLSQTVYLEKTTNGWMIYAVVNESDAKPVQAACPAQ